jgi:putative ABC transport system permease protein
MSSLSGFRLLHLRQSVRQPVRTVLAALALAAGVALTVASGLLISSIDHSFSNVVRSLAGRAQIRVLGGARDQAWVSDTDVRRIASVPGVASTIPVVQTVAIAEGASNAQTYVIALGLDCRAASLIGVRGCDEGAIDRVGGHGPLLVSSALRREVGERSSLVTDAGRISMDGALTSARLDRINHGRLVIFALPDAQRAFSRGHRYDVVYVVTKPGANAGRVRAGIERVVGDWIRVLPTDHIASWEFGGGPLLPLLGLVVVMALGLSGLLVYNITSLSLAERRRDLAVAGALGFAPRNLVFGALTDAALAGLAGGVAGCVAGVILAHPLIEAVSKLGIEHSIGARIFLHVSSEVLAGGVILAVLTSVVAAVVPARRATRVDLAAEVHGRAAPHEDERMRSPTRIVILAAACGASIALSVLASRNGALEVWQPTAGGIALVLTTVLALALSGGATPWLIRFLLRLGHTRGALQIALANLVSRARRTAALASAVAASVGIACVLGGLVFAIQATVGATFGRQLDGRVWVSMIGSVNDAGPTSRVPDAVVTRVRTMSDVRSVDVERCVRDTDNLGLLEVCTMTGMRKAPVRVLAGKADAGVLAHGEAIVAPGVARTRHLRPGSMLRVATADGPRDVRVAGVWANPNFNGFVATVSLHTIDRLYGRGPANTLMVRPVAGVSADHLAREIRDARIDPDVHAYSPAEMTTELSSELSDQVKPFWTVQRVLLFVALVATLSTLLLVGVQRRRELGIFGAVGFGPWGLALVTLLEALVVGVCGAALGIIASLAMFESLRNVSVASIGTTAPFRFAVSTAVYSSLLAILVVVVGGLLPAWRTSQLQIVDAIRDE